MEPLTGKEKNLVGFALFSTAMKIGPNCFPIVEEIIDKLEVRIDFEFYAKDWIEYSQRKKKEEKKPDSPGKPDI